MKNSNLIKKLSQDLGPVKRVSFGLREYVVTLLGAAAGISIGVFFLRLRSDMYLAIQQPTYILEAIILLALALVTMTLAYKQSIPGEVGRVNYISSITLFISWIALLLARSAKDPSVDSDIDYLCIRDIFFMSLLPIVIMTYYSKKGIQLMRSISGLSICLTGASFGAFASQIICVDSDPLHLLGFHALPVICIASLGSFLGYGVFKNI